MSRSGLRRLEGFRLIYAEAMWLGLPCIGSRANAAGQVISDRETGRLVPYDDRNVLGEVPVRILGAADYSRRPGQAPEVRARGHYSYDRFKDDVLHTLEIVPEARPSPALNNDRRITIKRRRQRIRLDALRMGLIVGLLVASAATSGAEPKRIVEVADENRDGRYTGQDIELALVRCRPGCLLRVGAHTYDDVAIVIDKQFSEGLEIIGAGTGQTVFRSPVPVQAPVFWVRGGQSGVVFRDFTLDGRKTEQTNAAKISDSVGIRVSNPSLTPSDDGRIESVSIGHFLTAGILIRDGRRWHIKNNHIEDIGCHTSQPCPRMPGKDANRYVKGRRTTAFGVILTSVGASGAIVEGNRIANITKIGIEAYTNYGKLGSSDRVRDVQILRNRVSGAVNVGITSNGGVGIDIIGNEVWDTGGMGLTGNGGAGISCGGASERIVIAENIVHDTDGAGIRANCQGDDVTIRDNRIGRACRRKLVEQGALHIVGRKEGRSRGLVVEGNQVDVREGECAYGLFLGRWRDIRLAGGAYHGGSRAVLYVADASQIRIEGLEATSPGVPSLLVGSNVQSMTVAADMRISQPTIRKDGSRGFVLDRREDNPSIFLNRQNSPGHEREAER